MGSNSVRACLDIGVFETRDLDLKYPNTNDVVWMKFLDRDLNLGKRIGFYET